MKLARMITSAALCGATLLAASATAQTKTVLTTLKKAANTDKVESAANMTVGKGPASYSVFFKIDADKTWDKGSVKYMSKIIGIGTFVIGCYKNTSGTLRLCALCKPNANNWTSIDVCDAPTDGKWHHAVFTMAASSVKSAVFYLDGESVYTGTPVIGVSESMPASLFVNNIQNKSYQAGAFGGSLAEASIWNRVLSAEEVLALKAGRPDSTALNNGCLGFWPLEDEPDQTTAADLLGAHDLTISSTAVFNFTTTDDFPDYAIGDTTIYVPIHRLYPTNLVEVVIGPGASVKDDMFEKDTKVTFIATAKDPSVKFVRWLGDVPSAIAFDNEIELVADMEKTVYPIFETPWVYSSKKLSDGYWTLNASISGDEVTVNSVAGCIPAGILDFSKPMVDAEGNPCKVVSFSGQVFFGYTSLRDVKLPNSLRYIGCYENQYNINGCFDGCTAITNMAPLLPSTITYLAPEVFADCWSLRGDLVLGGGAADLDCRPSPSWGRGSQFYNTAIDSLTLLKGFRTVSPSMFSTCFNLKRVEIAKGSVTNILSSGFNKCTKVTEFVMPERPELIEATAFNGWTSNQCRFVVHAADPGWAAYMADAANFISWDALDANTRAGYKTKFVGQTKPLGLSLANPKNQWLCSDSNGGMKILFR